MIVEEQGIGFRTGVRFPSAPLKKIAFLRGLFMLHFALYILELFRTYILDKFLIYAKMDRNKKDSRRALPNEQKKECIQSGKTRCEAL